MGADYHTHKDLADILGVSETTIKNYRRKFPEFLVPLNRGKPIRFKTESADICLAIRKGFDEGRSVEEVKAGLYEAFPEVGAGGEGPLLSGRETGRLLTSLTASMEEMLAHQRAMAEQLSKLESAPGDEDSQAPLGIDFSPVLEEIAALKSLIAQAESDAEEQSEESERTRVIVVRSEDGQETRYPFENDKQDLGGLDEGDNIAADIPSATMLSLPLVIRSEEGDFLGVAGRTGGRFSLTDFLELMEQHAPEAASMGVQWSKTAEDWHLSLSWGEAAGLDTHSLSLQEITTPKGNSVVLLDSLRIGGQDTGPAFLRTFLLRLRKDRLDDKAAGNES
jgi:hypothetical protein